jgi:hypothetical protein
MAAKIGSVLALSLIVAYPLPAFSATPADGEVTVASPALDKAVWTWVDQVDGEDVVFISRHAGGKWSARESVSSVGGVNVVPAVTTVGETDLVAVWTNYSGPQAMLRYRRLADGVWSEETQYHSGLSSNTAPTVAQDGDGRLWMVWSGFSGISDDIYYTIWEGGAFAPARAITSNEVPDVFPVLGVNGESGRPWVQWQQFTDQGYVWVESTWDGAVWTEAVPVPAEVVEESARAERGATHRAAAASTLENGDTSQSADMEIEIPPFISTPQSASLHLPGFSVQSLPVRNMINSD